MLDRFKLSILLQGLTLVLLGPACEASSLGLTVHIVPLDSDGGRTVGNVFSPPQKTFCNRPNSLALADSPYYTYYLLSILTFLLFIEVFVPSEVTVN